MAKKLTYKEAGVDYSLMDPLKKMAQIAGLKTSKNIKNSEFEDRNAMPE